MKILIVEDETFICELLCDYLKSLGHRVLAARDGQEGLEVARREGPALDLIFCDNRMPRMKGSEMLQQLREEGNAVPVVFITSHLEQEEALVRSLGVLDIIAKPFSLDRIQAALDSVA